MTDEIPPPAEHLPFDHTIVAATRPDRLAITSWLNRGPRPSPEPYRVLGLGCGAGANLLALAYYHPESTFVGVDPSALAVAAARESTERLGLGNLSFAAHPLTDVPSVDELGGAFDYVIIHDLLSWAGEGGRSAVLSTCRASLAPNGVAYVDHASPAGWHLRSNLRRLLLPSGVEIPDAVERLQRAYISAQTLAALIPEETEDPYLVLLGQEARHLAELSPTALARLYLGDAGFLGMGELVALVERHGLRFIVDAELGSDSQEDFQRASLREQLQPLALADADRENLVDTLTARRFRNAVLCRDDAPVGTVGIDDADPALVVAADLSPEDPETTFTPGETVEHINSFGATFTVDSPLVAAALAVLAERYPAGSSIAELSERAAEVANRWGGGRDVSGAENQRLGARLLELYWQGGVELRAWEPDLSLAPQPWPHDLARLEAERSGWVTTPYHTVVPLAPIARAVVVALDGKREPARVVTEIADQIEAGDLELELEGLARETRADLEAAIGQVIASITATFAPLGLLARA